MQSCSYLGAAILIFSYFSGNAISDEIIWRDEAQCGINCAYVFLRLNEIDIEYSKVSKDLSDSKVGTTMGELKEFLQAQGLSLRAVKLTPIQLASMKQESFPAIAFMEPQGGVDTAIGHFNVLLSTSEGKIQYIDGTTCAIVAMDHSQFTRQWSGVLLVKSSSEFIPFYFWMLLSVSAFVFYKALRRRSQIVFATLLFIFFWPSRVVANEDEKNSLLACVSSRQANFENTTIVYDRFSHLDDGLILKSNSFEVVILGNCRYIKRTDFSKQLSRKSFLTFDGENFVGLIGTSVQLHNIASAKQYPAVRFDSVYLNFIGIHVADPIASDSLEKSRAECSLEVVLNRNQYNLVEIEVGQSGVYWLYQTNVDPVFGTKDRLLVDRKLNELVVVRREVYSQDMKLLSTLDYRDWYYYEHLKQSIPKDVVFARFNEGKNVEKFSLQLTDCQPAVVIPALPPLGPGYMVADYREVVGLPPVKVVATTLSGIDSTIKESREILLPKINSISLRTVVVSISILLLVLAIAKSLWRQAKNEGCVVKCDRTN